MRNWSSSQLGFGIAAAVAVIDQIHKAWMIDLLNSRNGAEITIAPFFDIVITWNRGISYGLFKQDGFVGQVLLIGLALAAVLALGFWLGRVRDRLTAISLGLVIGGAAGNAIDRVRHGAVADFFYFHVGWFHWYVFNLADVAIVAGVIGLICSALQADHKKAGNEI